MDRDSRGTGAADCTMETTEAAGSVPGITGALDGLDKAAVCCPFSLSANLGTQVFVESGLDAMAIWAEFVDAVALSAARCPFKDIFLAGSTESAWGVLFKSEFRSTAGAMLVFLGGLLVSRGVAGIFSFNDPISTGSLLGFL